MIPFHLYLRLWRERWQLSEVHAAELLSTMPYNISRAEEGTLLGARAKVLSDRLTHIHRTMAQNRCVVRRVTLKERVIRGR